MKSHSDDTSKKLDLKKSSAKESTLQSQSATQNNDAKETQLIVQLRKAIFLVAPIQNERIQQDAAIQIGGILMVWIMWKNRFPRPFKQIL